MTNFITFKILNLKFIGGVLLNLSDFISFYVYNIF